MSSVFIKKIVIGLVGGVTVVTGVLTFFQEFCKMLV